MRALLAIVGLGAVLRVAALGKRSLWEDEGFTLLAVREPVGEMFDRLATWEGSPPLFYVLEWPWIRVFGESEASLRLLPALAGVALIPVVYAAGRQLFDHRAGLVAALLGAVSPQLVWHGQDGRTYAVYVLLAGLSFLTFLRVRDEPSRGRVAAWAVVSALALTAHYFAALLVVAEAVLLLRDGRSRRRVAIGCAVPGVTALALLPLAIAQSGHGGNFIDTIPLGRRLGQLAVEPVVGYQPPAQIATVPLGGLLVVAALVVALKAPPERRRALALPAGVGAVVLLVPLLAVPVGDYVLSRNMLAAWPALAVAAGGALGAREAGRAAVAVLAAYAVFACVITAVTADRSKYEHEDWRAAIDAVDTSPRARAIVVPDPGAEAPRAYREELFVPDAPQRVEEVAFVFLPPAYRDIGEASRPPRPDLAAPAGFAPAERLEAPTFTLVRFVATRPTEVDPEALEAQADAASDTQWGVVLQPH